MSSYVIMLGGFWVWLYVPRMIAWVLRRVA